MSIEGYKQMMRKIAGSHPLLANFAGHALRHTWNDHFSEYWTKKRKLSRSPCRREFGKT